jgi:Na+-driven multidrug efflux pump
MEKLYQLVGCCCVGFSYGFLPAGAFAFGANRFNRVFWLAVHTLWMGTLFSSIVSIPMIFWPGELAKIWSSDPDFLYWVKRMTPIMFIACPVFEFQYLVSALLQALQKVTASIIVSIVIALIPMPIFCTIMYFTQKNRDDPGRVLWSYPENDIWSLFIGAGFLWKPIKMLLAAPKDQDLSLVNGRNWQIEEKDG